MGRVWNSPTSTTMATRTSSSRLAGTSNASGAWEEHEYAPGWTEPDAKVETGDVNNDGRLDIVLTPSELKGERHRIAWFEAPEGDQAGPWTEHVIIDPIECVVHAQGLGDFNRDGLLDVAYAEMHQGQDPDEVCVAINSGRGRSWRKHVLATEGSHDIVVADLDGDGDPDIVGANHAGTHPVELWENLHTTRAPSRGSASGRTWRRHLIDDRRRDGRCTSSAATWTATASPTSRAGRSGIATRGRVRAAGPGGRSAAPLHNIALLFDVDRDGDLDCFGTTGVGSAPSHEFAWGENDGRGSFRTHDNIDTGGFGDFLQGVDLHESDSGDRVIGLSWHNGGGGIHLLEVPADPKSGRWPWRRVSEESLTQDLRAADIDRDGDVDFAIGPAWLRNDGGSWSWQPLHDTDVLPDRVRLGDINGDGRLDAVIGSLAISRPGTVAWYEQPEDASGPWEEHVVATDVIGPMSLDVADIDDDGDPDLCVGEHNLERPETARLFVFENADGTGGRWIPSVVHTGDEHHDGAQFVDIDDDGDLDIISIGWGHAKVVLYEDIRGREAR